MKLSKETIRQKLSSKVGFILDMDGTIYLGKTLFPFTLRFLEELKKKGKKYIFLTNNSSKRAEQYQEKLRQMGIEVDLTKIYTSGDATIDYLKRLNKGKSLYVMGTPDLIHQFEEAGFETDSPDPDFVVLGFDLTFTYQKLDKACRFIRNSVPFIASHPDFNCPLENGDMLPDCGALSAAITAATGVRPTVIGKPQKEILNGILRRLNLPKEKICMIGDRLMTDIQMGLNFGITSILVLTGETTTELLAKSRIKPDLVFKRVVDILEYI